MGLPVFAAHRWQVWGFVLAVAIAATALFANGVYPGFDVAASRALQSLHIDETEPFSRAVYYSGSSFYYVLISAALLAWLAVRRDFLGAAFLLAAVASRPFARLVKEVVERPRPSEAEVAIVEGAPGFSFPSGHALGTFLLVGAVWFVLMQMTTNALHRRLITAGAAAILLTMGLQRVYAGAHWTTDVLGGYVWGWLLLFPLVQLYRLARRKLPGFEMSR